MDVLDLQTFFQWDEFWQFQNVNIYRLVAAFTLSAFCSWALAFLYKWTYRGSGSPESMTQTLVLLSSIVALIMIVIGSNIARAFSLVGALSIIRFRTAVKSTRDTSYIFLTMAIGMAAGSRFHATAIAATLLFSILIIVLHFMGADKIDRKGQILKIQLPPEVDPDKVLIPYFQQSLKNWKEIAIETIKMGALNEATYQVALKGDIEQTQFLDKLRSLNENQKISLFYPDHEISL